VIVVYGLKNCDTCRKALKWLVGQEIDHQFVDVRADGPSTSQIQIWIDAVGLDVLVNRRSTTWRNLGDADRQIAMSDRSASFLLENPTLIKRPVFEIEGKILIGFNSTVEAHLLTRK